MKIIKLKSLEIENFKGCKKYLATFDGLNATIQGANGTGKTTIYEAYLWVMFDRLSSGLTDNVQPRNEDKTIKHKLVTSVFATLDIDGTEYLFGRKLKEKYEKPKGTAEETLKGLEYEYYFQNRNVSVTKTEYRKQADNVLATDKWHVFSNIDNFLRLQVNDRRDLLKNVAGCKSDEEIAQDFPKVAEGLTKKVAIDSYAKEWRAKKTKAKAEYDLIPSLKEEAENRRIYKDWDSLKAEAEELKKQIKSYDDTLQANADDSLLKEINDATEKLVSLRQQKNEIVLQTENAVNVFNNAIQDEIRKAETACNTINAQLTSLYVAEESYKNTAEDARKRLDEKKQECSNASQPVVVDMKCKTCGSILNAEQVESIRQVLLQEQQVKLSAIIAEGKALAERFKKADERYKDLLKDIDGFKLQKEQAEYALTNAKARVSELKDAEKELAGNKEYQQICEAVTKQQYSVSAKKISLSANDDKAEIRKQKAEAEGKLESVKAELAGMIANEQIDKQVAELEARNKNAIEIMDDCDEVLLQIQAFKKARVAYIEKAVSSLFAFTEFKMFEKNRTNDGEQDICTPYSNGIPYNEQNEAMKIAMGIDIVSGLMKAEGVYCPLFIDATERIANVPETECQQIRIKHIENKPLTIKLN